jgi:hypothetical protein
MVSRWRGNDFFLMSSSPASLIGSFKDFAVFDRARMFATTVRTNHHHTVVQSDVNLNSEITIAIIAIEFLIDPASSIIHATPIP